METKEKFRRYDADLLHSYFGLRDILEPERILMKQFAIRTYRDGDKFGPLEYVSIQGAFYEWYHKLESDRAIFMQNTQSGRDLPREQVLLPFLKSKLSKTNRRTVLDIGCGNGDAVLPFLPDGTTYVGLDSSQLSLNNLIKTYKEDEDLCMEYNNCVWQKPNGSLRVCALGALPASLRVPENKRYLPGLVIASMVLHHVPDYRQSINSLSQVTKTNGDLLIVTFDSDKRESIDARFKYISERTDTFTRGTYQLPGGILPDEYIFFHKNRDVQTAIDEDFGKTVSYPLGDFFRVFEAKKVKNNRNF